MATPAIHTAIYVVRRVVLGGVEVSLSPMKHFFARSLGMVRAGVPYHLHRNPHKPIDQLLHFRETRRILLDYKVRRGRYFLQYSVITSVPLDTGSPAAQSGAVDMILLISLALHSMFSSDTSLIASS